jgi:uncharacterized membrane protein
MTKLEFMKELESLLSDIPFEEREEALQYYNGYFEDAGEDNEEEIIKELGSPKRVASIIKADLNSNAQDRENRGLFTEKGYQDTGYEDEKFELAGRKNTNSTGNSSTGNNGAYYNGSNNNNNYNNSNNRSYNSNNYNSGKYKSAEAEKAVRESNRNSNLALLIILCIVGIPLLPAIFGVVIGIIGAIVGIIIGFGAAGIAMIIGGIALIVAGLIQISVPLVALLFCGSGLVVLGLGMLFTIVCVVLCKNVLPAIIKGIVNLCRMPFQNRSVTA